MAGAAEPRLAAQSTTNGTVRTTIYSIAPAASNGLSAIHGFHSLPNLIRVHVPSESATPAWTRLRAAAARSGLQQPANMPTTEPA
eukprot:COSAG04_NODE_20438_length_393_cov_1.748299_1_plen_84_part_01